MSDSASKTLPKVDKVAEKVVDAKIDPGRYAALVNLRAENWSAAHYREAKNLLLAIKTLVPSESYAFGPVRSEDRFGRLGEQIQLCEFVFHPEYTD